MSQNLWMNRLPFANRTTSQCVASSLNISAHARAADVGVTSAVEEPHIHVWWSGRLP
jgi:hypothetical protein